MATYYNRDGTLGRAWRASIDQMSWITGAGHAAQTEFLEVNGEVKTMYLRVSAVTANPTITLTLTDPQGNLTFTLAAIADGTDHIYKQDDFKAVDGPMIITEGVTVSVDPSADAGGSAQTLTVDLDLLGT